MTIRNYRQISKTDTTGVAMGGAPCRAIRDRIKFKLLIESFTLYGRIPILRDSITFSCEMGAPAYGAYEQMEFNLLDNIDYQE